MTSESEWKKCLYDLAGISAWGGDIKKALCALDAFIRLMDFDFSPHCMSGRLRHRAESSETLSIIHRLFRSRLFNHTLTRRMLMGRKTVNIFFFLLCSMLNSYSFSSHVAAQATVTFTMSTFCWLKWWIESFLSFSHAKRASDFFPFGLDSIFIRWNRFVV